jgi:RNA polymerase sigma-70 factor (ECF subfamily)
MTLMPNDRPLTPDTGEISALLCAWSDGSQAALDDLIPLIYGELRRLAHGQMNGERPGQSLQTTALVNEAYLRLIDYNRMRWQDRAHFFAVSAQLMRRILVDHARRNNLKRGAGIQHVSLEETPILADHGLTKIVAIHDALAALEKFDSRKARVVELRFFGGLTVEETAAVLKTSSVTVMRDWTSAKAWLYRELTKEV